MLVSRANITTLTQEMLLLQVVQPDVVLVTYDALVSDVSQLQPIEWEAVVVDERNRVQASLAKAHQALRELDGNFRLLLASGNPAVVCLSTALSITDVHMITQSLGQSESCIHNHISSCLITTMI